MPHLYYNNRDATLYAALITLPALAITHLLLLYIPFTKRRRNGDDALDAAKRDLSTTRVRRFLVTNLQYGLISLDVILSTFLTGAILWFGISEVAVENWHVVFGMLFCLFFCFMWYLDMIRVRESYEWSAFSHSRRRTSNANHGSASAATSTSPHRDHYSREHQNPISTLTKRSNRSSPSSSSGSEDEEDPTGNTIGGNSQSAHTIVNNQHVGTQINTNFSQHHTTDIHPSADPHWSLWYIDTIKMGFQERVFAFLPLLLTLSFIAMGTTLFVERSCICIHPQQLSTRITRWLQGPSCPPGKVCFNYLTLPEKPAEEMIIKFHASSVPQESAVYYDTEPRFGQVEDYRHKTLCNWIDMRPYIKDENRFIHTCDLTALTPNTTYYFITTFIEQDTETRIVENREMKFKTQHNSPTDPVRFAISGDRQSMSTISKAILHQATLQDISFFVIGGDLVYDNGMIHCYRRWDKFFREYEAYGNYNGYYIPLLTAIGNHEGLFWQFGVTPAEALNYVQMISHKVGDTGLDRKLNHIHLLGQHSSLMILDSGIVQTHKSQVAWMDSVWSSPQYASTNKLVAYHAPMYPSSRDYNYIWGIAGREHWEPLFDRYNVSVAFEHHDHLFKRTKMLSTNGNIVEKGGTIYLGDGSMGISRPDPAEIPVPHWMAKRGSRFHFWLIDIARDSATYRAIDHYGETFDILSMEKAPETGEWMSVENVLTEEERNN